MSTAGPAHPVSLAAAALRAGDPTVARSFRLHRPRGPFCGGGYCRQCSVQLADGRSELACCTAAGGAGARPAPRSPLVRRDPLRALGRVAERLPPWFYEGRLLQPRALRQFYLRTLRRLSSAPPLAATAPTLPAGAGDVTCDALVVGGGVAGLTAALELATPGRDVVLVEAEAVGGLGHCYPSLRRQLAALIDQVTGSGIRLLEKTVCLGLYTEEGMAAASGEHGAFGIHFEQLVVATGAYDRLLLYTGNDLPGTIGLRAFERYLAQGAFGPGQRIGVFAGPLEAERALRIAREHGIMPEWIAGPAELPGTTVPAFPGSQIARAGGHSVIEWVETAGGDRLPCDTLVLGFSQPSYELQLQAGLVPTLRGNPPVIATEGEASIPLLVVGEAAGYFDLQPAREHSRALVHAWMQGHHPPAPAPPNLGPASLWTADAFVCLCEDVRVRDIAQAVAAGFRDVELVKRRTGAGTGPCQGKMCLANVAAILRQEGLPVAVPTMRPPLRPVSIAALAGASHG